MNMDCIRAHLYISGRVQGVFFRHNTMKKAIELGLTGWVRNRSDGAVETVFEGPLRQVQEMIEWCHLGVPPAVVTGVDEEWEDPTGEFDSFGVRY